MVSHKRWIDLPGVIWIGLGTLVAVWNFWTPGISSAVGMLLGIYRVFELAHAWQHEIFFPRLGINFNFTYTAPLFQFYPPLVSYVTLVFHLAGFGLVEASKSVFSLSLFLAGLGAYGYAHWLFNDRRAALVSATTFLFAPYLLANVYVRGAAAETSALALLPWTVWAWHRMLAEQDWRWFWFSAILLALLVLAHNITAFFAMPLILVYVSALNWRRWIWNKLPFIGLAMTLGLATSAFYWLPAIAERGYVQIESTMLKDGMRPEDNLVALDKLVQPEWAFDYWNSQPFRLGMWQALLGAVAVLGIAVQSNKLRASLMLLVGIVILILLLQLTISKPFWTEVPLARFIQFPWRLLGIASFCMALLIGSLFCWRRFAGLGGLVAVGGLLVLIVGGSMYRLAPQQSPIWYDFSSAQVSREDLFERGRFGFELFTDYMPLWTTRNQDLSQSRPAGGNSLPPLDNAPTMQILEASPLRLKLRVKNDVPFPLRLHRLYFPGWQAYVNGQPIPTYPSGSLVGLVTTDLPPGEYTALVQFEETPVRLLAVGLSLLALVVLIGVALTRERRPRAFVFILSLGLLMTLVFYQRTAGDSSVRPIAYAANLQDEIHLLGYHLPKTVWQSGDTLTLQLYWLAQKTPSDDYSVLLHLVPLDDSALVAQGDSQPLRGYNPTSHWDPGELVADEHQIPLDDKVPPGAYQLLVGMYSETGNLTVRQAARVLSGDRIVLTQIEIRGK